MWPCRVLMLISLSLLQACNIAPSIASSSPNNTSTTKLDSVASFASPPPATSLPNYVPSAVPGLIRIDNKAYFYVPAKWQVSSIPVCWEPEAIPGVERTWVEDSVRKSWEDNSRIKFIFTPIACNADAVGIRITVRDVSGNDGPHTLGLGTQLNSIRAGMVLNFTFKTWGQACLTSEAAREQCIRSIAVHEFGHALGFAHEQNRPDTPGECGQKPQGANGTLMLTPWDVSSVMNYCNPIYNNNGELSKDDIIMLAAMYGKKS